jgi:uncharacterized membrane-anchored protein
MKRSNGKIQKLGIWDALAIALMSIVIWYAVWAFTMIICELLHFLNH